MDLLIRDDYTPMPSHLASSLGSSLLGCVPATSHASIDASMDLYEAQQNLDILVEMIDARQSKYYKMPTSIQVNL